MNCPTCKGKIKKARLDVYWCSVCKQSWLLHKLNHKTLKDAAKLFDEKKFRLPPK